MDSFDPHDSGNSGRGSSLVSLLHFPVIPSVSALWKRAESPLLQLLSAVRRFEKPSEKHLPDNGWSLPSSLSLLRYWQRGVQSLLEQRARFGWDWKGQMRELRDFLNYLPTRAELLAFRLMGVESATAFRSGYVPMESPEPSDADLVGGTFIRRSRMMDANQNSGVVENRLKVRAFDAPVTRMDNIRRARVLDRLMSSGRSLH